MSLSPPPPPASPSHYASLARRHYEAWLPERLAAIPEEERDSFFSMLGEQIAGRVESLELDLRGPDPAGESFVERLGRFRMARLQAEERAMAEVLPEPEEEPERPAIPVMTDAEICLLHGIDPEEENPDRRLAELAELDYWREHYRRLGRRPGLD